MNENMRTLTSYSKRLVFASYCFLLLAVIAACQVPALIPQGTEPNKTNPSFLKNVGANENTNPHRDEKCHICHHASKEVLTKATPSDDEKIRRKMMRSDLINLCTSCHTSSIDMEHRVGVPTQLNRENLPLDPQGNITCATTCHDVHTQDPGLAKFMLRHAFDKLCMSCHDV